MEISKLWTAWPVAGPWTLAPLPGGTNNLMWRAATTDGQVYVLRLIPDLTRIPRFRYQAALLQALHSKQLPFLLPLPLQAKHGDIVVSFEQEPENAAFAALYPLLPGSLPERNDSIHASKAGAALALLDLALAALPEMQPPEGFQPLFTFGELAHIHPLVTDPLAALERLPIDRDQAGQIRANLTMVLESIGGLYARLPQQLLHRDYDPSNILMNNQQVTAVLDFEFAGTDMRVLDICVSLSWWPVNLFGTGKEWDIIDALGTAYHRHLPLSETELLAIPDVMRLRDATSLMHRIGRYFAGLETDARMRDRVKHSLWREAWLSANQEILLQHVLAWN